jgi:uncharacterized protein (TIGR03437 family)
MQRFFSVLCLGALVAGFADSRQVIVTCGTYRDRIQEDLQLHRRMERVRRERLLRQQSAQPGAAAGGVLPAATPRTDIGDIAIIEDGDGVVGQRDDFNLDNKTLTFTPSSGGYTVNNGGATYDTAAANAGTLVGGLGDDDSRQLQLPFTFPFFGANYRQVYLNSDGNLTFLGAESSSVDRSVGRFTGGPPRIAGLFADLDPTASRNGVYVLSSAGRVVVSWVSVPEFSETGTGPLHTFQIRLYPDGRIEFAYAGNDTKTVAVVGIAPGGSKGPTSIISFVNTPQGQEFTGAIAERFSGSVPELDIMAAIQKFYQNHEDAYDYVVLFNKLGIADSPGSIASERTARTHWTGNGDIPVDVGSWYGSAARLESVINMGPLSQYPNNLNASMPTRPEDSPLSILAHEAGHLFLAFASIPDLSAPFGRPMLGGGGAHWSFNFNSDASLVEGNRIQDRGPGVSQRFLTTGSAKGYSPLDQYLMGFRAAEDVTPFHELFFVTGSPHANTELPRTGVSFNGERRDVFMEELIDAVGRRTPDHTMAQRRFRFAFILLVKAGEQMSDADQQKLNNFRTAFETYYRAASACTNCRFPGTQPTVDTTLRRALSLSIYPAAGVVENGTIPVTVSVKTPPESPLAVNLASLNGFAQVPPSVVIPAGAATATFELRGVRAGVEELIATPSDASAYETVHARVQVANAGTGLRLTLMSGGGQIATPNVALPQPVVVRVTDSNNIVYPGVRVTASVSAGGTVTPGFAVTDSTGMVSFHWTPGGGVSNQLTAAVDGTTVQIAVAALGRPAFPFAGVVNAASYTAEIGPGSFASIFGTNLWMGTDADASGPPWPTTLAGVRVLLDGAPAQLSAVRAGQINFIIPSDRTPGMMTVLVSTDVGDSGVVSVPVLPVAPAIFGDWVSGFGAIRVEGAGLWTDIDPARPGDYIEIYATGLGPVHAGPDGFQITDQPVRVFLGSQEITDVPFHGLVPGFNGGLYQINARIPEGTASGPIPLAIEIAGKRSNTFNVRIQ